MNRILALTLAGALALGAPAAQAQVSDGVIKIGILNDQSGTYADLAGPGSVVAARMASANAILFTPALPSRSSALARSCIQPVVPVSAGPPSVGLYLKPPSSGGLCEGDITIPSERTFSRLRFWTMMAREITGVGVTPSSR